MGANIARDRPAGGMKARLAAVMPAEREQYHARQAAILANFPLFWI